MTDSALDVAGVASLLNVSKATVYRLAETNEIPSFKVGNRWRFWEHEVLASIRDRDPWMRSNQARARRKSSRRAA